MITATLIAWPLVAALITLLLSPGQAKRFAILASVVEFAIATYGLIQFKLGAISGMEINWPWISTLGTQLHLGIDGISWILVLLTTLMVPLIIASVPTQEITSKSSGFYSLILIMEMALLGVFLAKDAFLFYIFWELALIPIYFICLRWGGDRRGPVTLKFFIYTLAGSLLMLVAFIYIYYHTPLPHSFDIQTIYLTARNLSADDQSIIFWALFFAFAVKMPLIPFHTWQPDTYQTAPAQGTMLLSGIMLKMGTYGVLRWLLPLVPLGLLQWGKMAIILSVIGVIYASCIALVQKDLKRLLAYSSIAHVGMISAGMFTGSQSGIQGALIQMFSHGVIIVSLFYIVDIIYQRTRTAAIDELGGIRLSAPIFAAVSLIILLGNVALPLTSGFVGEFLLMSSIFQWNPWWGAMASISIILGAAYMLRAYRKVMLGDHAIRFDDLSLKERVILFSLASMVLIIGVWPSLVLDISEQAVEELVKLISSQSN